MNKFRLFLFYIIIYILSKFTLSRINFCLVQHISRFLKNKRFLRFMRHISYEIPQNHSFRFFIKTKNGTRFKMAVPYIDDNTRTEKIPFLSFLFFISPQNFNASWNVFPYVCVECIKKKKCLSLHTLLHDFKFRNEFCRQFSKTSSTTRGTMGWFAPLRSPRRREHGVIMDSLMRALECWWMQMG